MNIKNFSIPNEWEFSKLKYLCQINGRIGYRGYTVNDIVNKGEGAITLGPSNIIEDKLCLDKNVYISWEKYHESPEIKIYNDDIILVKTASIGKVAYVNEVQKELTINPQLVKIKSINIDSKYLYYFLASKIYKDQILSSQEGGTTPTISQEKILNHFIFYPCLREQKHISEYLDKKTKQIDSLIERIEKKIELLKEHKTALINQYVTRGIDQNIEMQDSGVKWIGEIPKKWIFGKLRWFINDIKDGTHGSHASEEEGELLLSGKNVHDGFLKIKDNERRISKESHLEITKNGFPKKGDVLVSCVGSIGRSCVYELDETISFQRSVCFIRPSEKLNSYFLSYLVRSRICQEQLVTLTNQSTVGGVYMSDIQDLLITIPPLEEQKNIVKLLNLKLDDINLSINKNTKKIELLKEYRQSLISSVVTGKIRITEDML